MSRKIFITIPMLCLSLQSTGYASALRELVELGTPLKRVMSMLRPVVPLAREYSSQSAKQHTPLTSRLSAYINPTPQNPLIQRSFTTLPINRLTTNMSSVVPFPRVLDEVRIIKTHTRRFSTTGKNSNSYQALEFKELYDKIQTNCIPTLKKAYPQNEDLFDRMNSVFYIFLSYNEKKALTKLSLGDFFSQLREVTEEWFSVSKNFDITQEPLKASKERIEKAIDIILAS